MTNSDIEQIVLAIAQVCIVFNQQYISKKMTEGMIKVGANKEKITDIHSQLEEIKSYFVVLEDKIDKISDRMVSDSNP